mgnify:FL=1
MSQQDEQRHTGFEISDFISVFPNAASGAYCERVIARFEYWQEGKSAWGDTGRKKIWTRQEAENGVSSITKENDTYFLGDIINDGVALPLEEEVLPIDLALLTEFSAITAKCYKPYAEKYGILHNISPHNIAHTVRIQKYKPGQGYHIWHCDSYDESSSRRILVITLYLNTVEEGGETEFLYQSKRIAPVQGTLSISPAAWTHAHRGNPPLKGNKYIITTWLEFIK